MIVGTAGHIDHGKTSLVHALTGVQTDRLPEEKRRGISIELGYAYVDGPAGERIGFVDVPGHERLVHTMLAGATGIQLALLVVAADDGVMPQTREHLAALALLGVPHAVVAITKVDRVEAARRAQVMAEVAALLEGTALQGSPQVAVSSHTGEGIDELRTKIYRSETYTQATKHANRAFRLAIDRIFSMPGTGTVVTGTVHAGQVSVGDELQVAPAGIAVRVRGVRANGREATQAHAGERCALALAGLAKDEALRGAWVVAAPVALSTQRIDVRLRVWAGETQPLRSGTHVHLHCGAAGTTGTVALLEGAALPPGGEGLAQLLLQRPLAVWHGDRIILRDAAASRILTGATVIDPFAPVRYRQSAQRLAELRALESRELPAVLQAAAHGTDSRRLAAAWGEPSADALQGIDAAALRAGDWAWGAQPMQAATQAVLQALAAFHARQPDELGPDAQRLRRLAVPRLPDALWAALLERLQAQGAIGRRASFVHLPAHGAKVSANEQRIAEKALPLIDAAAFEGAWVRDLAAATHEPESLMRAALAALARRAELHQVVRDLYLHPRHVLRLAAIARALAGRSADHAVAAADFRDAAQLGRKRAIQVLEYFDRAGLTRRAADRHKLRLDCAVFTDEA